MIEEYYKNTFNEIMGAINYKEKWNYDGEKLAVQRIERGSTGDIKKIAGYIGPKKSSKSEESHDEPTTQNDVLNPFISDETEFSEAEARRIWARSAYIGEEIDPDKRDNPYDYRPNAHSFTYREIKEIAREAEIYPRYNVQGTLLYDPVEVATEKVLEERQSSTTRLNELESKIVSAKEEWAIGLGGSGGSAFLGAAVAAGSTTGLTGTLISGMLGILIAGGTGLITDKTAEYIGLSEKEWNQINY